MMATDDEPEGITSVLSVDCAAQVCGTTAGNILVVKLGGAALKEVCVRLRDYFTQCPSKRYGRP